MSLELKPVVARSVLLNCRDCQHISFERRTQEFASHHSYVAARLRERKVRQNMPANLPHRPVYKPMLFLALLSSGVRLSIFAQGTAFTHQGRLNDGVSPASGLFDKILLAHLPLSNKPKKT